MRIHIVNHATGEIGEYQYPDSDDINHAIGKVLRRAGVKRAVYDAIKLDGKISIHIMGDKNG